MICSLNIQGYIWYQHVHKGVDEAGVEFVDGIIAQIDCYHGGKSGYENFECIAEGRVAQFIYNTMPMEFDTQGKPIKKNPFQVVATLSRTTRYLPKKKIYKRYWQIEHITRVFNYRGEIAEITGIDKDALFDEATTLDNNIENMKGDNDWEV